MQGDIIGGIYATIDMAKEAWDVLESLANTVQNIIVFAQALMETVLTATIRIVSALSVIRLDDTIRNMGSYLADTAQDFQLAENQNVKWLHEWGV